MRRLIPTRSEAQKRATKGKRAVARNARISWRRRLSIAGMAAALSAGLSLAAFMGFSDQPARAWRSAQAEALVWTARRGLAVTDIQAIGRQHTETDDLLQALGIHHQTPILGLDLVDAKRRVESLPWVAHAEVERLLPRTLRI
ncbi:MAG: FtsQ-type POTRA domain-containing protein, partial [Rhodospirillaceae bacterium]|nr:FtsQ-type POTRA domain-containing protein [Rhodospirillaceae bacterium]